MNYINHFLMSTRTTFHLPTRTWSTRNQEKKSVSKPKEEKIKETNKEIKKGEWKRMFNELLGSFFNVHKNHIPFSHTHMKYKKSEPKEEKIKEINKEIKKGEWKRMFNELLGSFF